MFGAKPTRLYGEIFDLIALAWDKPTAEYSFKKIAPPITTFESCLCTFTKNSRSKL